jgi:hypothetical protein
MGHGVTTRIILVNLAGSNVPTIFNLHRANQEIVNKTHRAAGSIA